MGVKQVTVRANSGLSQKGEKIPWVGGDLTGLRGCSKMSHRLKISKL